MKKCEVCGVEFEPKNPKGKVCSTKCRMKKLRKNKAKKKAQKVMEKKVKPADKPGEMPKNLSLADQIQWKIDHLNK